MINNEYDMSGFYEDLIMFRFKYKHREMNNNGGVSVYFVMNSILYF